MSRLLHRRQGRAEQPHWPGRRHLYCSTQEATSTSVDEFVKSIKPYFDGYQEKLLDIQQNELITLGEKQVLMTFGPSDDVAGAVDFVVGEVHDDVLSMGKLLRMGYTFDLSNRCT